MSCCCLGLMRVVVSLFACVMCCCALIVCAFDRCVVVLWCFAVYICGGVVLCGCVMIALSCCDRCSAGYVIVGACVCVDAIGVLVIVVRCWC